MTYKEIAVVLTVRVGFDVSERRIKRLVKMNGLRHRVYGEDADATAVIEFIWSQLQGSGRTHGYRCMHRVLAGQEATTLAFPHPDKTCILDTDASDVAIGAVLSQVIDGTEHPIAFYSRIMSFTQRNYCLTRRELLAVIAALQHFRHYLIGNKITLRTDHHSLKWLNTFKRPEVILARWVETLAEFDFEIEHGPGRVHCNADGVSRPVCKQYVGHIPKTPWVDELERADELTEILGIRGLTWAP